MIDGKFALAFTTGMVATVNPCGFVMLPAYLSFFLGTDDGIERRSTADGIARAIKVSAVMALGFLSVFLLVGVVFKASSSTIAKYAKWPTIGIGVLLIAVGIAMVSGWHVPWSTPRLDKGGKHRSIGSLFLFGVSYAIANISCGIAVFVGLVSSTLTRSGFVSGVAIFLFFGLGMALVIGALTVSLALATDGLLRRLRWLMTRVDRIAGGFLIIVGAYLVYYWLFNITTDYGTKTNTGGGLASRVEGWANSLTSWITDTGAVTLGLALGAVVAAALAFVLLRRRRPA
jgi:cytochrome c-type biogenesis protein